MSDEPIIGESVALYPVPVDRWKEMHALFQDPAMWARAASDSAPDEATFKKRFVERRTLRLWEIRDRKQSDARIGYAGVVWYAGPPHCFFLTHTGKPDENVPQSAEILRTLAKAYFQGETDDPRLFLYVPIDFDEEVYEAIEDLGFDDIPVLTTIDPNKERAFVMLRETFDSYYG